MSKILCPDINLQNVRFKIGLKRHKFVIKTFLCLLFLGMLH
jgi:hypothetical protein